MILKSLPSSPGAKPACPQPHEDGTDELPERGGIHRVQLMLLTVAQIVVVEGAPGETDPFGGLIVMQ